MTNDEWCRTVLKKFFPSNITNQTIMSPALSKIAGQIWRDWQQMKGFSGAVDVAAHNLPHGAPPNVTWVGQVLLTIAWRTFAGEQAVDPWLRARLQQKFGPDFRIAIGSGGLNLNKL